MGEWSERGVLSWAWPSNTWMVRRSTPSSSRWVAKECLITWGLKKLGHTRLLAQLLADLPNAGQVHGRPRLVSRKEPVLGLPPAPVYAEHLQQLGGEHDLARIFSFPFPDVDHHPLAVDIRHLQLLHFRATQAGRVHSGQQGAMLQVDSGIEQSPHLLSTQDGGELASLLGLGYFLVEPGLFEDAGVEKLEGGEAKAEGGPGQLALID